MDPMARELRLRDHSRELAYPARMAGKREVERDADRILLASGSMIMTRVVGGLLAYFPFSGRAKQG